MEKVTYDPTVPKLGNPLDKKTEKQKIITQNYTKNKKAKNNYLSVARFFGTIFQERVPAGENKTIGNTLQHQNQLPKKFKTKQAVTPKEVDSNKV